MKTYRNKKGSILVPFIVFITVLALISALVTLSTKYGVRDAEGLVRVIGEKQAEVFKIYQRGENALFYVSQSAKLTSEKTLEDLAAKDSGCGVYFGYGLWSNRTTRCFPVKQDVENKFKSSLSSNINAFLFQYQDAAIAPFNTIELSHNSLLKIIGRSSHDLVISTAKTYSNVLVTHYYAPSEKDFSTWYTGEDYKNYPGYDIESWCVIPLSKRGFYEDVQCEGAGVSGTGEIYSYQSIKPTKETSKTVDKIGTVTGTQAIPHRTIAVAPNMIPYNSKVSVSFEGCTAQSCCNAWNGEYIAEDTGIAMKNDWARGKSHIDLFVGTGKEALQAASCIPSRATLQIKQKDISTSDIVYTIPQSFKTEINYSFDEYDALGKSLTTIADQIAKACKFESSDFNQCVEDKVLKKNTDFVWSLNCGTEKEKIFYSLLEKLTLCSQSSDEGVCSYNIPSLTEDIRIDFIRDDKTKSVRVNTTMLNGTLEQISPHLLSSFTDKKPIIPGCSKISLVINKNKQASLRALDCGPDAKNTAWTYSDMMRFYALSTPTEKRLLSFIDPEVYDKEKQNMKELSVVNQEIRLCAQSKYSFLNSSGRLEPYEYRIAFFAGDTIAPKPVKDVAATDTKNAEANITISFTANEESDINHYNVYYSTADFSDVRSTKYLGRVQSSTASSYSKAFNLSSDGEFFFAVTAIDNSGNENPNVKAVSGASVDDLNPGPVQGLSFVKAPGTAPQIIVSVVSPATNEDSSLLKDLQGYVLYLKEAIGGTCAASDIPSAILSGKKYDTAPTDLTITPNTVQIELPDGSKSYCLVAIAQDEVPESNDQIQQDTKRYDQNSIILIKT